ncbi:MAG: carbohydrate kinase family protein [Clostridiales bacterium]|nr:carbohydrate kinase family protein [Clostridiales bacterium]
MKQIIRGRKIFCAGDISPDIILPYGDTKKALALLAEGDTLPPSKPILRAGGSIGHTVAALGLLGLEPKLLSVVGTDEYSDFLLDAYAQKGVDVSLVGKQKERINLIFAILDGAGERVIYLYEGPNAKLPDLTREIMGDELLPQVGWLHSNGFANEATVDFMERCSKAGAVVSFDLNLRVEDHGLNAARRARIERAIAASDVIFGSGAEEFAPLTGIKDLKQAAQSLARPGRVVIARDGARPIHLFADGAYHEISFQSVPTVSPVGSGDLFNGGFIAACALGRSARTAVAWGYRCAAQALASPAYHDIPTRAQLEAWEREGALLGTV